MTEPSKEVNKNISDLDLKSVNNLVLILGKPASGKTFLIRDLVFRMKSFIDVVICFSGSTYDGGFDYLDQRYVHSGLDENTLKKMMSVMKTFRDRNINRRFLLIFDDLQLELSKYSDTFLMLINNHRHLNADLIVSTQYSSNMARIAPNLRQNSNLGFIYYQPEAIGQENAYNSFAMGLKKQDFFKLLQKATSEKYHCLVVDKRNIEHPFNQYIAQSHEKFKFKTKV